MPGSATFAEMLDRELACGPSPASPPQPLPAYQPPHPLLFDKPLFQFRASAYGNRSSSARASRVVSSVQRSLPVPARRLLTLQQQRALDKLAALGVELGSGFTARELRSAYRMLARRHHPDRHPSSTLAEQAQLARRFADLNELHSCLSGVLKEPAPVRH